MQQSYSIPKSYENERSLSNGHMPKDFLIANIE